MAQPSPFSNVPTTADIATQRKLALALQGQAIDTSPVGHWTQALARAVQGGVGGMNQSAAAAGEKSRQDALAQALAGSGTFGGLSEGDRAIMTNNPEIMQSVATKALGNKMDPNSGKTDAVRNYEYSLKNPGFAEFKRKAGEAPSSVREYEYYNSLDDKGKQAYIGVKRAQQWKDTGTEFVLPNAANPAGPVSAAIPKDVAGKEAAEKIGQARGEFIATYPKTVAALESLGAKKNIVDEEIKEARKLIHGTSTGPMGALLKNVPWTDAQALKERVKTILANVGFDELSNMRAESPTGGALGAIAVQELTYLQAVRGSLEQAQRPEDFKRILTQLENFQNGAVERRQKAFNAAIRQFGLSPRDGGTVSMNPAPVLDKNQDRLTPGPPVRRRFNPATGELE